MPKNTLYEDLVMITEEFLGPAARRFIDRQTRNHLMKEPGELNTAEFIKLTDWLELTLALLTNDEAIKSSYSQKLNNLIKSNQPT